MIVPKIPAHARATRPSINRALVAILVVCWLVVAAQLPYSLHGAGILVLLALVGLDALLGVTTGWLAFQPTSRLDERQRGLRDRAYRMAFRLVGAGVVLMLGLYIGGAILSSIMNAGPSSSTSDGFSARTILAIVELLIITPTGVVAWLLPSDSESGDRRPARWLPLLAVPAVALVWVTAVLSAPMQSTMVARTPDTGFMMGGATCGHFGVVKRVAAGFGGAVRLEVEVCWNGQQAFAFGDPALPRPVSVPPEEFSMPMPGLTSCATLPLDTDFGRVVGQCTGQIDPDGTLRLVLRARVLPLPGGAGSREVQIRLVVTRDGKVVAFE
jgi:hypothetical protein